MAITIGRMPDRFQEGQRRLSASRMNNWRELTQTLANVSGRNGIGVRQTRNGWTISGPRRAANLANSTAIARARVTGYVMQSNVAIRYAGKILDWTGADLLPDDDPIDLYCVLGESALSTADVRAYLPHLILLGGQPTNKPWPVYAVVEDDGTGKPERRWYVDTIFIPWCEQAARGGTVPRFPKPPPGGGEPGGPVSPTIGPSSPPAFPERPPALEGDGLNELIDRQRGGRPCNGCGDG